MKIGLNKYFVNNVASRLTVPHEDLINMVSTNLSSAKPGDKPGTLLVSVDVNCIRGALVTLKVGDAGNWVFEPRSGVDNDMPVKRILAPANAVPDPFTEVLIVVYSNEALGASVTDSTNDYELVAVITSTGEEQPVHPDTLDRNYFGLPGGSPMDITVAEYVDRRRKSVMFWYNKAIL